MKLSSKTALIAVILLPALSACGDSSFKKDNSPSAMYDKPASSEASVPGVPDTGSSKDDDASLEASDAPYNQVDATFIIDMVSSHREDIKISELALSKASSPEVKNLASSTIKDRELELEELKGIYTKLDIPRTKEQLDPSFKSPKDSVPPTDDKATETKNKSKGSLRPLENKPLTGLSGNDFDLEFLTVMLKHSQKSLDIATKELTQGADGEAKALAERIISRQVEEIDLMEKLLLKSKMRL